MTLEGIGIGAWLIGTHARAVLAVGLQRFQHDFNMLGRVHRAQAGEDMQCVLAKMHPVVVKAAGPPLVPVPA